MRLIYRLLIYVSRKTEKSFIKQPFFFSLSLSISLFLRCAPNTNILQAQSASKGTLSFSNSRSFSIRTVSMDVGFQCFFLNLGFRRLWRMVWRVPPEAAMKAAGIRALATTFASRFSPKFQLLKAWESPLPIPLFLTTHAHSVKAVLSSSSSPITSDILRRLPSLQLVVATSVGLDQIDLPACRRRGISIANAGKVLSEDCADLAVGLFVDVLRKISAGDRFVRSSLWPVQNDFTLGSKVISFVNLPCL